MKTANIIFHPGNRRTGYFSGLSAWKKKIEESAPNRFKVEYLLFLPTGDSTGSILKAEVMVTKGKTINDLFGEYEGERVEGTGVPFIPGIFYQKTEKAENEKNIVIPNPGARGPWSIDVLAENFDSLIVPYNSKWAASKLYTGKLLQMPLLKNLEPDITECLKDMRLDSYGFEIDKDAKSNNKELIYRLIR